MGFPEQAMTQGTSFIGWVAGRVKIGMCCGGKTNPNDRQ
jgi:hypothetical protein